MYPIEKVAVNKNLPDVGELPFEGTGAVFKGFVNAKDDKYVARVEMYLDGELVETANLPASYTTRRNDLFWKYQRRSTITYKQALEKLQLRQSIMVNILLYGIRIMQNI